MCRQGWDGSHLGGAGSEGGGMEGIGEWGVVIPY